MSLFFFFFWSPSSPSGGKKNLQVSTNNQRNNKTTNTNKHQESRNPKTKRETSIVACCSSFYTYKLWFLTDELGRNFFAVLNCYQSYFISSAQILGNKLHIFICLLMHAQNILGYWFKIIFQIWWFYFSFNKILSCRTERVT